MRTSNSDNRKQREQYAVHQHRGEIRVSSPTMMPMSLEEIAQAVQGRLIAGTAAIDTPVATSTFTDSRQIVEGSVFVAIAGERVDGHDYVSR